jgi:hypothetical protein
LKDLGWVEEGEEGVEGGEDWGRLEGEIQGGRWGGQAVEEIGRTEEGRGGGKEVEGRWECWSSRGTDCIDFKYFEGNIL